MNIELGISSFGETTQLEETGKAISHDQRIRDLLEEIILADKLNIDALQSVNITAKISLFQHRKLF